MTLAASSPLPDRQSLPPRFDSERLESAAALLMACQRHWLAADQPQRIQRALACNQALWREIQDALASGEIALPLAACQNLLILSVYADSQLRSLTHRPRVETLEALIGLTRNLAVSLRAVPGMEQA